MVDWLSDGSLTFSFSIIASAATQVNIAAARRHFEKLEHVEAA